MPQSSTIKTAIVLAAGEGTRLRPLTLSRPKALIPILDRPFIDHLLENLSLAGIKRAVIVTGYLEDLIIGHLNDSAKKIGIKTEFVTQEKALGTGHAFALAEKLVKDEKFIVLAGDNYYAKDDLSAFIALGEKSEIPLAGGIEVSEPKRFGIFSISKDKVVNVVEKPEKPPSKLANASLYLFGRDSFELAKRIPKSPRGEYEITDVLKILAGRNRLGFFRLSYWTDLGSPWDILDLNLKLLSESKGRVSSGAEIEKGAFIKGNVSIGKGTIVKSGAYIEGPAYVGENCSIGPNCYIRSGTVLGEKTKVGNAVEIKNSTFFGETNISHLSYCADSVIGSGCNFGAGTITANLRHDKGEISMSLNGKLTNSRRKKLGVVMGDNSKTGIHCSIYPGKAIGPNSWTDSASLVDRDVPAGQFLRRDGTISSIPLSRVTKQI